MGGFLYYIIVGAIAGWIGSKLYHGESSGLLMNILLGIVGAVVGRMGFRTSRTYFNKHYR